MSFIYLAGPYSHPEASVREARYKLHRQAAWTMLQDKMWCYAPIVHCHPMAIAHKMPTDFAYWQTYNIAMLERSGALWIIKLRGWDTSKGVTEEIAFAKAVDIPVQYKTPEFFGIDNPLF